MHTEYDNYWAWVVNKSIKQFTYLLSRYIIYIMDRQRSEEKSQLGIFTWKDYVSCDN